MHRVCDRLPNQSGDDAGFTLVEALVSIMLFVIVAAAAASAIVTTIKTANGTNDRVIAANLAQQDIETARAVQYPHYPAAVGPRSMTVGNKQFTLQRTVSTTCPTLWTPGQPTSMLVTAKVTWPGSMSSVAMSTVIAC
jgi:prepilin-type N-terminal cleavage/methylation domain-containing protein